jgi:hypothetical protein
MSWDGLLFEDGLDVHPAGKSDNVSDAVCAAALSASTFWPVLCAVVLVVVLCAELVLLPPQAAAATERSAIDPMQSVATVLLAGPRLSMEHR